MDEFEIRLHVPAGKRPAVERALRRGSVQLTQLRATYFDTADEDLKANGISLRLRLEGRQWVQTVKARGDSAAHRLEDNFALAGTDEVSGVPDPKRHKGTPAGKKLLETLAGSESRDLLPVFSTEVDRLSRIVNTARTRVEVSLDHGHLIATGDRRMPVCELEFELKDGEAGAAVELARRWAQAHGLWIDSRSKAQRGRRLAREEGSAPATATDVDSPRKQLRAQLGRILLANCLDQVLANASDIAAGAGSDEHVHQIRVGLRRARTALKDLPRLVPQVPPECETALRNTFQALGAHRDAAWLAPRLQQEMEAAGGPPLAWGASTVPVESPEASVNDRAFQDALFDLLEAVATEGAEPPEPGTRTGKEVRHALSRLDRKVRKDAARFRKLATEQQHALRKHFKRLRYLAELVGPLYPHRGVKRFVAALKPVQSVLGDYQDTLSALELWTDRTKQSSEAWFGVGWLASRRDALAKRCAEACDEFLDEAAPFWD